MKKSFNFYCVTVLLAIYLCLNADYQRVNALSLLIHGAKEYSLLLQDIRKINKMSSFKRKVAATFLKHFLNKSNYIFHNYKTHLNISIHNACKYFCSYASFIISYFFLLLYCRRIDPYRRVVIKCNYVCNLLSETCRVSCTSPREEGLYQNCEERYSMNVFGVSFQEQPVTDHGQLHFATLS